MLNVGLITEGFVLDHIQAGKAMQIYSYLGLDKLDCQVAIIKNAKSNKMERKDIIKIECPIDVINLDILGFIDHNITVNIITIIIIIIKDGNIAVKILVFGISGTEIFKSLLCNKTINSILFK